MTIKESMFTCIVDYSINHSHKNDKYIFKTIKEALNYVNDLENPYIYIKKGVYTEKLNITKSNLTIVGEDPKETVISYSDYAGLTDSSGEKLGTFRTATVNVHEDSINFQLFNITIRNSWNDFGNVNEGTQAVAFRSKADKSSYYNVIFESYQDTLYLDDGRHYLFNCEISGDVDYIFGGANVIFDACKLINVARPIGDVHFGYIAAPRTNHDIEETANKAQLGFLFRGCNLTSTLCIDGVKEENKTYLARPWRKEARAVFMECTIAEHISKIRWTDMQDRKHEDAYFREFSNYNNTVDFNILEEEVLEYYCSDPKTIFDQVPKYKNINGSFEPKPEENFVEYIEV